MQPLTAEEGEQADSRYVHLWGYIGIQTTPSLVESCVAGLDVEREKTLLKVMNPYT